jgi:hypothetical protein
MEQISELRGILANFFNWNKCRLDCLGQIIQALFAVRSVNLTQIAAAFQTHVKEGSAYRRVCRFFTSFTIDLSAIVPLVFRLFPLGDRCVLILDRTNWKWGKTPINILMLSIAYRGIGIPLFWMVLDLEGNSCASDRAHILQRAIAHLGAVKIKVLLADREFIGTDWFKFLCNHKVPFIIRVKKNFTVTLDNGGTLAIGQLRKWLARTSFIHYPIKLWGLSLYASIERKQGAREQLIVVSNVQLEDPLLMYRRRWEIETMFACLKTRGFRMEDTHLTDPDKIEKMLFVLAIAFCWAYRTGDILDHEHQLEVKAHGRKARSLFREGLNLIRRAIFGGWLGRKFRQLLLCFTYLQPKGYAA